MLNFRDFKNTMATRSFKRKKRNESYNIVGSFFFNISYSLKTCWTVIYLNRDKPTKMHFKQSLKSQFQQASDRTTEGFIWASNISNSTWEPSSHCPVKPVRCCYQRQSVKKGFPYSYQGCLVKNCVSSEKVFIIKFIV